MIQLLSPTRLRRRDPKILALLDQSIVSASGFLSLVVIGRYLPAQEFWPFGLAVLATLHSGPTRVGEGQ